MISAYARLKRAFFIREEELWRHSKIILFSTPLPIINHPKNYQCYRIMRPIDAFLEPNTHAPFIKDIGS